MKATALCTTVILSVVAALGGDARADHRVWRTMDNYVFDAMSHTRDARWEVHDHFSTSRDYEDLLQDARRLTRALNDIQDAIYMERSPHQIQRLIDDAHDILMHFQEHAEHSDFAATTPGHTHYDRNSYRYRAPVRNAGYVHVRELVSHLNLVDDSLHEIEYVLNQMMGHGHDHGLEVVPDPTFRTQPFAPGPGAVPPGPVVVPELSAASDVSLPLVRNRSGEMLLRLLLK